MWLGIFILSILSSPALYQFSCLAVDPSGEIVTAGGLDVFDIYVWSLQTGRLLEVLTGHEAPIAALQFSPSAGEMERMVLSLVAREPGRL